MVFDSLRRVFSPQSLGAATSSTPTPTPNRPTTSSTTNLGPLETLGVTKNQLLESQDKQRPCYPLAPSPGRARAGPPSPQSSLRRSLLESSSPLRRSFEPEEEVPTLRQGSERRARLVVPGLCRESQRLSLILCSHGEFCVGGCFGRECREAYLQRASVHGSILGTNVDEDEDGASRPSTKHDSILDSSRQVSGQSASDRARDIKCKGRADLIPPAKHEGEDRAVPGQIAADISNIAKSFSTSANAPRYAAGIELESIRTRTPPGYEGISIDPAPSPEAGPLLQRHRHPSTTYEAEFFDPILDEYDICDQSSAFGPTLRRSGLALSLPRETTDNGEGPSGFSSGQRNEVGDGPSAPLEATPCTPAHALPMVREQQSDQEQYAHPDSSPNALKRSASSEEGLSSLPFVIPPANPLRRPGVPRLRLKIPYKTYTEQYRRRLPHDEVIRPLKIRRVIGQGSQMLRSDNVSAMAIHRRPNLRVQIPEPTYTKLYQGLPADDEVSTLTAARSRMRMPAFPLQAPAPTHAQQDHDMPSYNSVSSSPPWDSDTPQTVIVHRNQTSPDFLSTPLESAESQLTTEQSSRAPQRLRRPRALAFISSSSPLELSNPHIRTPEVGDTPNWRFVGDNSSPATPATPTPMPRQRRRNAITEIPYPVSTTYQLAVPSPAPDSESPTESSILLPSSPTADRPLRLFIKPVYRSPSTTRQEELRRRRPTPFPAGVQIPLVDSGYASARDFTSSTVGTVSLSVPGADQALPEVVEEDVPVGSQNPSWQIIEPHDELISSAFEADAVIVEPVSPSSTARISFPSNSGSSKSKNRTQICPVRRLWWKWSHPDKYKLMKENKQAAAGNWEKVRSRDHSSELPQGWRCCCRRCRWAQY